jgi:V/A-type H+-transporting ATPase subunit F
MKRIVAITPPDAGNGFACCGAQQRIARPGEALQALQRALGDPESGVVILDERLLEEVGEEQMKIWEEHWPGVLVVLPAPEGGAAVEDYAARLIRRAVGYHVKVRT